MKIAQLVEKMKDNGISLPEWGTGRGGRVLARDLEWALGDYFFNLKYADDPIRAAHCALRRSILPMKSYRYDKLKAVDQQYLMQDGNEWHAEEKHNGWRIVITYIPTSGFMFWGGNISDVDFLPKDYSEHLLVVEGTISDAYLGLYPEPFLIDAEALCFGDVVTQDGMPANNTLEAVGAVLGSHPEQAIQMQKEGAALIFSCFDFLKATCVIKGTMLKQRAKNLHRFLETVEHTELPLQSTPHANASKTRKLHRIWKQGGEGIILKNANSPYVSGGRLRDVSVKLKRTMSGEIGDELDAFVSGHINTPEWRKKGLIGGLKLSVYLKDADGALEVHHIATCTAMPDETREALTRPYNDEHTDFRCASPSLKPEYLNKVLAIDGQELSSRNRKLMHAKVNWLTGFRKDKSYNECTLELEEVESEKF